MIFIVWITNDIHIDFNDIHWEGCLHIGRCFGEFISVYKHTCLLSVLFTYIGMYTSDLYCLIRGAYYHCYTSLQVEVMYIR